MCLRNIRRYSFQLGIYKTSQCGKFNEPRANVSDSITTYSGNRHAYKVGHSAEWRRWALCLAQSESHCREITQNDTRLFRSLIVTASRRIFRLGKYPPSLLFARLRRRKAVQYKKKSRKYPLR